MKGNVDKKMKICKPIKGKHMYRMKAGNVKLLHESMLKGNILHLMK